MTYGIDWAATRDYLRRRPVVHTTVIAGSPEWRALSDDDPQKLAALVVAGSRWCLEEEIAEIDWQRGDLKRASVAISEALPWSRVAKRIRDRDAWYRDHPDLKRRSA